MPVRRIIVIGGSVGALPALLKLVRHLNASLDVAIFLTIHTAPSSPGVLDDIVNRESGIPAHYAVDGEPIRSGAIYLAPADRHLLIADNHVRVTRGPRENRFRPAIDPLFRTAAEAFGAHVIGIVLSGSLSDGAAGAAQIKKAGGAIIVQDPADSRVPEMPRAAMKAVAADHVLAVSDMPSVIAGLVGHGSRPDRQKEVVMETPESSADKSSTHEIHHASDLGLPTPFTCPDCGGTLWQSPTGDLMEFRCHVGHRFGGDGLKEAQDEALEQALWTALRALEESSELRRRMAAHATAQGMKVIAESYASQAGESEDRAAIIRRVLMNGGAKTQEDKGSKAGIG